MTRRLLCALLASAALGFASAAGAQGDSTGPLRVLVGFPPGGAVDFTARIVGDQLGKVLGRTVVIENKAGAGGIIGAQALIGAPPDGNTLLVTPDGTLFAPDALPKAPFDSQKDFAPVALLTQQSFLLAVSPSLGIKTTREFVAWAKAQPAPIAFGTISAPAGTLEFAAHTFFRAAGIPVRPIPYKGGGEAVKDLIGGQLSVVVLAHTPLAAPAQGGKVVLLGVTSRNRSPLLRDIPALAEAGYPGVDVSQWIGVVAPAGTPSGVVAKLSDAFNKALADPDVKKRLAGAALETVGGTPEAFRKRIGVELAERRKWLKQQESK